MLVQRGGRWRRTVIGKEKRLRSSSRKKAKWIQLASRDGVHGKWKFWQEERILQGGSSTSEHSLEGNEPKGYWGWLWSEAGVGVSGAFVHWRRTPVNTQFRG